MASGTVKSWDAEKGYGFLSQDNGPDVFVHFSAIQTNGYRSLEEGQRVEFEIGQGPKGPQADMVRPPVAHVPPGLRSPDGRPEQSAAQDWPTAFLSVFGVPGRPSGTNAPVTATRDAPGGEGGPSLPEADRDAPVPRTSVPPTGGIVRFQPHVTFLLLRVVCGVRGPGNLPPGCRPAMPGEGGPGGITEQPAQSAGRRSSWR
ncbi:hypothetical protein GCM10020254_87950 [Streptomyces goshikiensis]